MHLSAMKYTIPILNNTYKSNIWRGLARNVFTELCIRNKNKYNIH